MSGEEDTEVTAVIEKTTQRRIFKIIVIGDSNVGKTCLTFRFCGGQFPDKTEATIGVDFREKTCQVDNETIKVCIAYKYFNSIENTPLNQCIFVIQL